MYETPCGKTYKSKYWFDAHIARCPDCANISSMRVVQKHQRAFAEANIRILQQILMWAFVLGLAFIIAFMTIWHEAHLL